MKKLISSLILCSMLLSIFAPVTITLPSFVQPTQQEDISNQQSGFSVQGLVAHAASVDPGQIGCDVDGWLGVVACGLQSTLWYILIQGTQFLVGLTGTILDWFIIWSISSTTYTSQSNFIEEGWEIIRDMTNIIFLFALLIIAFNLVLGRADANSKRLLIKTIVLALVINFSLFGAYAIIDASNVLARILYVKIEAPEVNQGIFDNNISINGSTNSSSNIFDSEESSKSISLGLASRIQPQRILSLAVEQGAGYGIVTTMILVVGIVNLVLIYVFLSVTLLFVGRGVALMILSILAPIAVASMAIPRLAKVKYLGWEFWFKDFISTAFMAPIFILFLYLSVQFLSVGNPVAAANGDILTQVLQVSFPLIAFTVMLLTSKKVAEQMSGEIAGQVVSGVKKIAGGAVAVAGGAVAVGAIAATGGAALAGGAMRGGAVLAGGQKSKVGRMLSTSGKTLQSTNFNFAQTRAGKFIGQKTGVNMGASMGNLSYSRASTAVRSGTNAVRGGVSDLVTGRTPASVEQWEKDIQAGRDKLTARRAENVGRQAERKTDGEEKQRNPDGTVQRNLAGDPVLVPVSNLQDRIRQMQADSARRSSADTKAEKDGIEDSIRTLNATIQSEKDQIAKLMQDRALHLKNGNIGGVASIDTEIASRRGDIQTGEKQIKEVEKSGLEDRIKEMETQLQNSRDDARARMLNRDKRTRLSQQDSGLTIVGRKKRVDTQAARFGRGEIRTDNSSEAA